MPDVMTFNRVIGAFADDPMLAKRIMDAVRETPKYETLFNDITRFMQDFTQKKTGPDVPINKKRKLENGSADLQRVPNGTSRSISVVTARDVSFSIPLRKKLHLEIDHTESGPQQKSYIFSIKNNKGDTEYRLPAGDIAQAYKLPVPEKAQKQYNFCLIPKNPETEPILFTLNDGYNSKMSLDIEGKLETPITCTTLPNFDQTLNHALNQSRAGLTVETPSEDEFSSAIPEPHRKNERAYHVKAFKGSKEGYLFFLSTGIFFGFKKPLELFPFDQITSVSYLSVLQRTFQPQRSLQNHQRRARAGHWSRSSR